jgi:CheY-specific phosphatase CheX
VSGSTPADLAVAFRSYGRRLREAIGDAPESSVIGLVGELRGHVEAAAAMLGASPEAGAVADAIMARRPDDWDDASLSTLREHAAAAAAILRRIAAATGSDEDD